MTAQFIRKVNLIVGNASGQGLDLSQLHIRFQIWSATTQSPKHTSIRVYNVADTTAKRLQQEFQQVFLQAGYGDNVGQIFSGSIKQIRKGRENATDTFVDIIAADGDEAYNWAVVNTTLAAGWSQTDYHGALMQSFAPFGVTAGVSPWQPSAVVVAPTQADIAAMQAKVNAAKAAIDANQTQQSQLVSQAHTARVTGDSYTSAGDPTTARTYYLQAQQLLNQSGALATEATNSLIPNYQALTAQLAKMQEEFAAASKQSPTVTTGAVLPRGKVCYGMARDYMRQLAGASGTQWTVQDGRLHMIPVNGVMPGQSIVITSATGMVGIPTQTVDGIIVKCLLNPNIVPGSQIQINNASIQQAALSVDYTATNYFPSLDDDGFYKVYAMTQSGDTRGPNFYTEMICAAVNGTAPLTSTYTNAVVSNGPA